MLMPNNMILKTELDTIDIFEEEEDFPGAAGPIPITVAMCSCGRSWKVKLANLYLYDQESWENAMQFHFTKEHKEHN